MEHDGMNRVAMVQCVRLASQRVPRKLLQVVGETSLIDRGCAYLRQLGETTGAVPLLAVPAGDGPLLEVAERHGLRVLLLDERADRARRWPELIEPFTELL